MTHRNIAIVWDFDGTLTPDDSTSKIVEHFLGTDARDNFWKWIKKVNGSMSKLSWERMLSSDAPTWMYVLSRIAFSERVPLTKKFFSREKIINLIESYPGVDTFLQEIKTLQNKIDSKKAKSKYINLLLQQD